MDIQILLTLYFNKNTIKCLKNVLLKKILKCPTQFHVIKIHIFIHLEQIIKTTIIFKSQKYALKKRKLPHRHSLTSLSCVSLSLRSSRYDNDVMRKEKKRNFLLINLKSFLLYHSKFLCCWCYLSKKKKKNRRKARAPSPFDVGFFSGCCKTNWDWHYSSPHLFTITHSGYLFSPLKESVHSPRT